MMREDLSTVNPEEWVIAHIRLDSHLQIDDIKHLFKSEMNKIKDHIYHWYFHSYCEPQKSVEDCYRYKIFIKKKRSISREDLKHFIRDTAEHVLCEVKPKTVENPDFDTESILDYKLRFGGISQVYLNCLATMIRSLITEEMGKELNGDQMMFLLHVLFNQFKDGSYSYDKTVGMKLVNNALLQTGTNPSLQHDQ